MPAVQGTYSNFGDITQNLYYSTVVGGVIRLITLCNYVPFHPGEQHCRGHCNWLVGSRAASALSICSSFCSLLSAAPFLPCFLFAGHCVPVLVLLKA